MIPVTKFFSYFIGRQASIRTLILALGMVLVLLSSFVPAKMHQHSEVKAGWLTPSATGMEKLGVSLDTGDPNSDLHLTVRKQTKVKCVKKLSLNALVAARQAETDDLPSHPITGFESVKRPAYYIFLFRYTLF